MSQRMGRERGPGLAVPAGESGHSGELGSAMQKGGNHVSGPCFPFVCVPGTSLGKGTNYLSLQQCIWVFTNMVAPMMPT